MNWETTYVVFRQQDGGKATIVHSPADLSSAKYWMQYIAEPFDVLCKTPIHPKHTKKLEIPEYWAHKEKSGKLAYQEADWRKVWLAQGWDGSFSI